MDYKATFRFKINKQRIRIDGKAAISLRITINGERSKPIPMDVAWYPHLFNVQTGDCKAPGKADKQEAQDISLTLSEEKSRASTIITEYRLARRYLDLEIFLEEFDHKKARNCFIRFMKKEIKWRFEKKDIAERTRKNHETVLTKIMLYVLYQKESDHYLVLDAHSVAGSPNL